MARNRNNPSSQDDLTNLKARQVGPRDRLIGARIKQYRLERRLTLDQLGAKLAISGAQLQKIEAGKNRVSASTLIVVSEVLDVPVGLLLRPHTTFAGLSEREAELLLLKLSEIPDANFLKALLRFVSDAVLYSKSVQSLRSIQS